MYSPKHDKTASSRQVPGGGIPMRNLSSQQFGKGKRASGSVKTGYNPLTYNGGGHRK